ncbi:MAG: 2-oxo acid dehydrogenase subunit E2 [Gammaproteobacteria bacterium]|nr:MAG: 2-oxo acid dehydrogenase subunit E2 [Gammaproteobacteria bacterium]
MTTLYRMPSLGADMEAGTLIEWVLQPGQTFAKGDVIAVVETQKGAIEVEVFHDGVMGRQLIEVGRTVPVGTPMAELETLVVTPPGQETLVQPAVQPMAQSALQPKVKPPGGLAVSGSRMIESVPPQAPSPEAPSPGVPLPMEAHPLFSPPASVTPPSAEAITPRAPVRPRASPVARRLAQQRGLSLEGLAGSGPAGAILLTDVQSAAAALASSAGLPPGTGTGPVSQPPAGRHPAHPGLDLAAMRQAIAAAMAHAKREIPHYYLSQDIDLTPASDWLARRNAELPPERRLLMGVLFIKAVALTLTGFPELNGFDREGRFAPSAAIHVGCATAIRGGGLVAPAIHDTDQLDLDSLMARLRDLVTRVRSGGLRASELAEPTITVSSLGERGVDRLYGIIYPPQVAIVGFGTPRLVPWVLEGRVVPRQVVTATLAADHRHSDGHRGALFLAQVGQRLQAPEKL